MKLRLFLLLAAATASAADRPYVGKWKANLAKSDFGQTTVSFKSLPGGEWQSTGFGITYKFKIDGNDYPDGIGGTIAWKAVDANTWETVAKANGKVTETDTFKLSPDGKTLTDVAKQMKPDGGSIDSNTVFTHESGGTSLAGKWRTKKVSGGSETIEFAASGDNGLIFKDLDMRETCEAKLDGTDYPCSGPTTPPGFTAAMKNEGGALVVTVKKDGKPLFRGRYTVSSDGKSMTAVGAPANSTDKFKMVFDRM